MNKKCSHRVDVIFAMQRTLRNETLRNALKNFIVPIFSKRYYIIAFRALWDVKDNGDKIKAELNIWEKQKELDQIVLKNKNTMAVFSCMTAMQSSFLKRKMLDRKRRINDDRRVSGSDTDNDYDGYEDDGIIPG